MEMILNSKPTGESRGERALLISNSASLRATLSQTFAQLEFPNEPHLRWWMGMFREKRTQGCITNGRKRKSSKEQTRVLSRKRKSSKCPWRWSYFKSFFRAYKAFYYLTSNYFSWQFHSIVLLALNHI